MSSDLSEPEVDANAPQSPANKRRSGRVSRKPDLFTATPAGSTKRKRTDVDEEAGPNGDPAEEDDDDDSETEGEPDEEEMRERRARARKTKSAPARKPAAKRSKPNGNSVALPVRAQPKVGKKRARALDEDEAEKAGGLYGQSNFISKDAPAQLG